MRNFYLPLADDAQIYDNSENRLELIASKQMMGQLIIHDVAKWDVIQEAGR